MIHFDLQFFAPAPNQITITLGTNVLGLSATPSYFINGGNEVTTNGTYNTEGINGYAHVFTVRLSEGYILDNVNFIPDENGGQYLEKTDNTFTIIGGVGGVAGSVSITAKLNAPTYTTKRLYVEPTPIGKVGNLCFKKLTAEEPSVPTLLAGTYVWDDDQDVLESLYSTASDEEIYLNFKSNNTSYTKITSNNYSSSIYSLYYDGISGSAEIATRDTYEKPKGLWWWHNNAYKTFVLETDQEVSQEFKDFVDAHATYTPTPTGYQVSVASYYTDTTAYGGWCTEYSTDNGATWTSFGDVGPLGTFTQIKFRAMYSFSRVPEEGCKIKSTTLNLSLRSGDNSYTYSDNFILTQDVLDIAVDSQFS